MDTKNSSTPIDHQNSCENCWLNNFAVFNNCSSPLRNQILANTQTIKHNKGDNLITAGDMGSGVFCIQSGAVKISKKGPKNKEFILWIAGTGDMVGLDSLIDDEPFSYSASAIGEVTSCFILTSDLKTVLQKEPVVSVELMKNLCNKLNFIEQRITSISRKKIRAQCAEMLISITTKGGVTNDKNLYINYSVKDLANLIGTNKTYLYKILSEFTNKKILAVHKRKLFINNMSALSSIASGNNKYQV